MRHFCGEVYVFCICSNIVYNNLALSQNVISRTDEYRATKDCIPHRLAFSPAFHLIATFLYWLLSFSTVYQVHFSPLSISCLCVACKWELVKICLYVCGVVWKQRVKKSSIYNHPFLMFTESLPFNDNNFIFFYLHVYCKDFAHSVEFTQSRDFPVGPLICAIRRNNRSH